MRRRPGESHFGVPGPSEDVGSLSLSLSFSLSLSLPGPGEGGAAEAAAVGPVDVLEAVVVGVVVVVVLVVELLDAVARLRVGQVDIAVWVSVKSSVSVSTKPARSIAPAQPLFISCKSHYIHITNKTNNITNNPFTIFFFFSK